MKGGIVEPVARLCVNVSQNKTDKRRASYYNFYTGNKWGRYDNYDMAINSSTLGIDETAELIAACARKLMEE